MTRSRMLPALLALAIAGCGVDLVGPEDLPTALAATSLATTSWDRVVRDDFSYAVPPGFAELGAVPIDSDVVTHVRDGDSLHHDFGFYSGRWTPDAGDEDVEEAWTWVGGRVAQLVSYRLGERWVLRAWWGSVVRSPHGTLSLVLRAEFDEPADRAELLAAIHSIRFE